MPVSALPPAQSPPLHIDLGPQEPLQRGGMPLLQHPLQRPTDADPQRERELQQLRADAESERLAPPRNGSLKKPPASWLLGLIQLHGAGMDQDRAAAKANFEQARRLGFRLASAGLAWCAIDGCNRTPDGAEARRWIAELRPNAPARALFLEWVLATRLAPVRLSRPGAGQTIIDGAVAQRDLLVRSALGGDPQALNELGLESLAAGRLNDAMREFKAAAPQSDAAAANLKHLQERLVRLQEPDAGAPPAGDALFAEAQRFHRGEGRVASYADAIRLYGLASVQGNASAQRMLALIYARPGANGGLDLMWMQQLSTLDVGSDLPRLGVPSIRSQPQRDPTPLFDMLPRYWRIGDQFSTR